MQEYHLPVLLHETIDALCLRSDSVVVDATFGGGGHSREILQRLGEGGRLYAFDQDMEAVQNAQSISDDRLILIDKNFRYIKNYIRLQGLTQVDAIIADLGVSSHQFDKAERGFSTRFEARLDMRMDGRQTLNAWTVINTYSEEELARIFFEYGELRSARRLAREICTRRLENSIDTTLDLKEAVAALIPKKLENKMYAMLFQALRIEVNEELASLKEFLMQSVDLLKKGGHIAVLSYHSLEDRLVKNFLKSGNFEGRIEKDFFGNPLVPFCSVGKIIVAEEAERERNTRSRSAKLRVAEKR